MADPTIKIKRSAVEGKIPTADQLPLGEIALNTYDGKFFASKNVGIGTTVFVVNPWSVGTGTNTYNTYFTSGSVGIATTNPQSALDVRGTISIGRTDSAGINSISSVIDINSWEYYGVFKSVAAEDTAPADIFFKDDGTKMFILGDTGNDVNEYSLSTPWEVSTAGFTTVFSVAAQETVPTGLYFKPDGTRMYICGQTGVSPTGDRVYSYTLSNPWSLVGVTTDTVAGAGTTVKNFNVGANDTGPHGLYFKDDGTKMYVVGVTGDAVYEYTVSTAWEIDSTVTLNHTLLIGTTNTQNLPLTLTNPTGIDFNTSGIKMYITDSTRDLVARFDLSTPWDLSTAVFYDNVYIGFQETVPTGIFYQEDQSKAYIVGTTGDTVYQYNTDVPSLELASSGISTRSSIILNNEARLNNRLYVTGDSHFSNPVTLKQTLQVDGSVTTSSNLTVSGGTITAGNVAASLLTGNTTTNISAFTALTSGTLTLGGTAQTGTITIDQSASAHTLNIASGVTTATNQKTVNIGAGGTANTRTLISLGSATAGAISTVTIPSPSNLLIGTATTTGTASQPLQVTGGAYVSGSVGIGTTNPLGTLHLQSNTPIIRFAESDASANNRNWNVGVNGQEFYWQALTDAGSGGGNIFKMTRSAEQIQTFEGRNSGNTWFVIDNNTQRVGVGTTNPVAKLDVRGDISLTGIITTTGNGGVGIGSFLRLKPYLSEGGEIAFDYSSGVIGYYLDVAAGNAFRFANYDPNGTYTFVTNSTEKVRISNIGNLGIGTINPTVALQLSPTASISNVGSGITLPGTVGSALTVAQFLHVNTNTSYIRIKATRNATGSDWLSASTKLLQVTDVTEQGYIEYNPNGSLYGMAFGSGATEWARFTQTGNFGIGTTNPTSKLDIQGDAKVSGVVTATEFSGNASSATYATTAGIATSVIGGIGSITQLQVTGISTFTNGPVFIGAATSTGTASQRLQVSGGAYVSGNLGIGITNPQSILHLQTSSGDTKLIIESDADNNNETDNAFIIFRGDGGIEQSVIKNGNFTGSNDNQLIFYNSTGVAGGIIFATGTDAGYTNATERLRITPSGNIGIETANPTSKLDIQGDAKVSGVVTATTFIGALTGTATTATKLETARTFQITGDVVASSISFDGSGNVSLASTIQPNSVALGSDTTGDYVSTITGTSNQITVTSGTGEGSTPTLSIPNQFTVPQDITVTRDLQVDRNLNVNGNITIGGTSATIFSSTLNIYDPDIVLGVRTDGSGNDISTDNTANHGGIAIASTEGTPLISLYDVGVGETNPATYKKFMWFKSGTFSGLGTDAWISNYAIGIGSTQFPSGTRLAAGAVQFTENDLAVVRNINASGVVTATTFVGSLTGTATTATNLADAANITTGTINSARLSGTYSIDISGNATTSGYATTAGIATYATSSGIASALTASASVNTTGIITASSFVKSGGTSSEFLKADGSVDSSTYLTSYTETDTLDSITTRGNTTTNGISVGILTATSGNFSGIITSSGANVSGITTISVNTSTDALRITQTGTGNALVVEDETSPDATPFVINRNGDVGIGTDIFSSKLNVNGDTNITGASPSYRINGTKTLEATTLGSAVVNSSLTSLGTLTSLTVNGTATFAGGITTVTGATLFAKQVNVSGVVTSNGYNATTGNDYKINGTSVLTSTTLGSGVTNSSLTSVGTLGSLNVSDNVGIGTTNPGSKLTVNGAVQIQQDSGSNNRLVFRGQPGSSYRWNVDNYSSSNEFRIFREDDVTAANGAVAVSISTTGTLTATRFSGDGSLLTGITASGSGVVIQNQGSNVGTATTINFSTNLTASFSSGTATISLSNNPSISGILTADQVYTSNNGNGQNVRIGDDFWLGDVNVADTTRFSGAQDSTRAFVIFGSSDAVALGRTGTGPLYYGGNFNAAGVVTATSYNGSGTNLTGIVTSIVAGTNVTISGSTGQVTINASGGGGSTASLDLLEVMMFA